MHRLFRWFQVFLWMGFIFWLSSIPQLESDLPALWDFFLRKFAHATEFGILSILWLRALRGVGKDLLTKKTPVLYGIAGGLSFLYAVSDEYHQTFVSGRHGAFADVLIDTFGVVIALLDHYGGFAYRTFVVLVKRIRPGSSLK